jgi:hypothetical protein
VYKEIAFKGADLDVNYLQFWVAVFQFFIGLALIPFNTFKFLGDDAVPWDQLPYTLSDGAKCLVGINTQVTNCWTGTEVSGMKQCDDCHMAFLPVVLYMCFNICYNLFIVLVIKHGGAAIMYVIMTIRLPLVQLAFALKFINNPPDAVEWNSMVGLVLILIGLVCYRSVSVGSAAKAEGDASDSEEANDEPMVVSAGPVATQLPRVHSDVWDANGGAGTGLRASLYNRLGVDRTSAFPDDDSDALTVASSDPLSYSALGNGADAVEMPASLK